MKRFFNVQWVVFVGLLSLFGWSAAEATSFSISDDYIGGTTNGIPSKYLHNGGDVIAGVGQANDFDIDGMDVEFTNDGNLRVEIQTDYQNGTLKTEYGDLFISTDGWEPFEEDGSPNDVATTGTTWEYAFDVSDPNLYDITDDQDHIRLSNDVAESNWAYYRKNQEVQVDSAGLTPVKTGGSATFANGNFSMEFAIAGLGFNPDHIGFRWTMTCANDVIEGGTAPVPEPTTLALLGLGFIGMAVFRLRAHRK